MARALDGSGTLGAALAVIQRDALLYAEGFGRTHAGEDGVPVTPETIFGIASATKVLVGTAIMRMVEEGYLNLDAPVDTYLPWRS